MRRRRSIRVKDVVRLVILAAVVSIVGLGLSRAVPHPRFALGVSIALAAAALWWLPQFEYLRAAYLPRRFRSHASQMRSRMSAYHWEGKGPR